MNDFFCTLCNTYIDNNQEKHIAMHEPEIHDYMTESYLMDN